MVPSLVAAVFPLLVLLIGLSPSVAVIPTSMVEVSTGYIAFASPAWFGPQVPEKGQSSWLTVLMPTSSADACEEVEVDVPEEGEDFYLLSDRGNCAFEAKAIAAEAVGAKGLLVMNSLEGIYQGNSVAVDKLDYECSNGEGWVAELASPVWSTENTDVACTSNPSCSSQVCVVTNTTDSTLGHKVCCVWDLYLTMGFSDPSVANQVTIPTMFITMAEGKKLKEEPHLQEGTLELLIYDRPRSELNLSSFLLWGLGVTIAVVASVRSADDMRSPGKALLGEGHSPVFDMDSGGGGESLELEVMHTFGFVVFASCMLLLLFFFNLYLAVVGLFCVSASTAVATVVVLPMLRKLTAGWGSGMRMFDCGALGVISHVEIASVVVAFGLALWWLLVRNTSSYGWVLQDLFGCCLCCTFLTSVRINSVKVATVLLSLAFLYDIFWVFLSPYVFSESVMVKVATGGDITEDPTFCEKYPESGGCQVNSLPMLLELPRVWDYLGGYAMLGLGDIVIPGLLLSFCWRYDVSMNLSVPKGYFIHMVLGYAVGLMMANMAVYISGLGQPALLYLVPCTLGYLLLLSHSDGTLVMLWAGPPTLSPSLSSDSYAYSGLSGNVGDGELTQGMDPIANLEDEYAGYRGYGSKRGWSDSSSGKKAGGRGVV